MPKWLSDLFFGLCFGVGFALAAAVIQALVWLITHAGR